MKIAAIGNIRQGLRIRLSTDEQASMNFIVCEQDDLNLFVRLGNYFIRQDVSGLEVDMRDAVRCTPILMFIREDPDYGDLLEYLLDVKDYEDYEGIVDRTNAIFNGILDLHAVRGGRDFLWVDKGNFMIPKSMPANQKTVAYYALLAAIRERYGGDYPLVVRGFASKSRKYALTLVRLIHQIAPQSLIFIDGHDLHSAIHVPAPEEPIPSVPTAYVNQDKHESIYDIVRDGMMGRAYEMKGESIAEYSEPVWYQD